MEKTVFSESEAIEQVLQSAFKASQERARERRQILFDPRGRAWLALVPAWTEPLAELVGFPTGGLPLVEFITQAEAAGLCTRSTSTQPDGTQLKHFWMPDSVRAIVLEELRSQYKSDFLERELLEVGMRIRREKTAPHAAESFRPAASPISTVVDHWSELAVKTEKGPQAAARYLTDRVLELLDKNNTGEALAWVRVGALLAQAIGGSLQSDLQIANHQIELAYRRAHDERRLKDYLVRDEQIADFRALVEGKDSGDPWALHYIGMGGVGKTMLLRYITARLPSQLDFITSRVDFDHLSPDYPVREPGQLLLELANELRLYGFTDKHEYIFNELKNKIVELREVLSRRSSGDPLAFLRDEECKQVFKAVVRRFASLLQLHRRRVILILDTCEELAKAQPIGDILPSVAATFRILEHVHDLVPSVRVVFSGRRLLARSGSDWRVDNPGLAEARAYLPEKIGYLRLHEIRGFDEDEAVRFLSGVKKIKLEEQLQKAILKRSQESGTVAEFRWDNGRRSDRKTRYTPFDLALYADWVRDDPALDARAISFGKTDPYVELRIVGRIRPENVLQKNVLAVLPAVVLLRRFEKAMLRPVLDVDEREFESIFLEVGDQEWMDTQRDERLQTTFLEVDRNLYPRLCNYYDHRDRKKLIEDSRKLLGPHLAELVRRRELSRLTVDHLDAALRTLPPHEGAELWGDVERRIPQEVDWNWVHQVVGFILGAEGAVSDPSHPLRAALLAALASARINTSSGYNAGPDWEEVARTAPAYPDSTVARQLEQRSLAGRIAAFRSTAERPSEDLLSKFWQMWAKIVISRSDEADALRQMHADMLASSICAALEALLERAESSAVTELSRVPDPFLGEKWHASLVESQVSQGLTAFAAALVGRSFALHGEWKKASAWIDRAETPPRFEPEAFRRRLWFDWRPPDSLLDRLRLEVLRLGMRSGRSQDLELLLTWQKEAATRLSQIDAERLISIILTIRLTKGLVPLRELPDLETAVQYDPNREPLCWAHRVVPSLFISLANGWLALGNGQRSLDLLNQWIDRGTKEGDDLIQRNGQRAKVGVIRRLRMDQRHRELLARMAASPDPGDAAVAWPAAAVLNISSLQSIPEPDPNSEPSLIHAWWSSQCLLAPEAAARAIKEFSLQLRGSDASESDSFERLTVELDGQEVIRLARLIDVRTKAASKGLDPQKWHKAHPHRSEQALRLMLRHLAIVQGYVLTEAPIDQVGVRRSAEIALDEGELLALRLPGLAVPLFDLAYDWFNAAADPIGATIAAIRCLIAEIHAGRVDQARERLSQFVQPAYEKLTTSGLVDKLPRWTDLLAAADLQGADWVSRLEHSSWRGWLHRLFFCMVWAVDPNSTGPMSGELRKRFWKAYDGHLPIEMDLWPNETVKPQAVPSEVAKALNAPSVIKQLLAALLSLSLALGFLVGGYYLFTWFTKLVLPPQWLQREAGIQWWQIGSYVSLLGLLGSSPKVITSLRALIRSMLAVRTTAVLEVALSEGGLKGVAIDRSVPIEMRLLIQRLELRLGWPIFDRMPATEAFGKGSTLALRPYREAAAEVPREIIQELAVLKRLLGSRLLAVPLRLEPELAFFSWEAVLTLAIQSSEKEGFVETFQFWRRGVVSQKLLDPQSAWTGGGVNVVCDPNWNSMVAKGWRSLKSEVALGRDVNIFDGPGTFKILHLIGSPVMTSAGMQFQILRSSYGGMAMEMMTKQAMPSATRGEVIVRPESMPLDRVAVCVVQAEPVETLVRFDTDREQAAHLRAFAADLLGAGAQNVIVLPALSTELAQVVLSVIGKTLQGRSAPDLVHLLLALSRSRLSIVRWRVPSNGGPERSKPSAEDLDVSSDPAETLLELALDVCLFSVGKPDTLSLKGKEDLHAK